LIACSLHLELIKTRREAFELQDDNSRSNGESAIRTARQPTSAASSQCKEPSEWYDSANKTELNDPYLTIPGILAQKSPSGGKSSFSISKTVFSPTKRSFEPSTFDEDDSENIDPAIFLSPSKKSKSDVSDKPFTFSPPSKPMPPPAIPSRLNTPAKASMTSPRAPMTAPAGRSPKRKATGVHKNRRVSAPFGRIDPPFGSRNTSSLPFSLDAAINGTFSNSTPKDPGATIQESMPKNWFFDIYEESPEEQSTILMEHSTLTLDLSSDEESSKKAQDDRGKENTPPEDYNAPTASRPTTESSVAAPKQVKKADIIRRKIVLPDDMDDGQRSPLSDLETDPFIPEGLDKESHIVVNPTPEKSEPAKLDMTNLFATAVPFTSGTDAKSNVRTPSKGLFDIPVVDGEGDIKGDIIVWEDSPSSEQAESPVNAVTPSKAVIMDENIDATVDNIA
jgi:hypothetical protein